MRKAIVIMLLSLSAVTFAQDKDVPPAPKINAKPSAKYVVVANVIMFGSGVVAAHATKFGTQQCIREIGPALLARDFGTPGGGGLFHPWKKALTIALPIDGALSLSSFFLARHKHNAAALLLPGVASGVQFSIASEQYIQGCF